jgi:hypothetical protein
MPIFEVQMPDGQEYEVDAPDEASAISALGRFSQPQQSVNRDAKAGREMSLNETAEDVVKSAGAGLARGAIDFAATPSNIRESGGDIVGWASEKLGATPETAQLIAQAVKAGFLAIPGGANPTGAQVIEATNEMTRPAPSLSQLVTGEKPQAPLEYRPRTFAGEVAENVGEFAPAVAAGPGGAARKIAMTAVPAIAGATAKEAAEGTAFEPYAEPLAVIASGGVAAGGKGSLVKEIAKDAPARASVKQAADAMYGKLRAAGITYDATGYQNMAVDIARNLKDGGFRKAQAPLTADAVEAIAEQLQRGSPDYNDLESIRKTTSKILREKNATDTDKEAAGIVLDALDDFMSKGAFSTNGSIPAGKAATLMKEAREMARRNIIAKQVDDIFANAETYQSGFEAGLRNGFSNYLRSGKAKGLTKEERQAFLEAAKGNWSNNLLGSLGRLGVDFGALGNRATLLPGGAAATGFAMGEPTMGIGTVAIGTAAKYASRQGTKNAAERARDTVLAGREAQKAGHNLLRAKQIEVALRRLITADNARAASSSRDDRRPSVPASNKP